MTNTPSVAVVAAMPVVDNVTIVDSTAKKASPTRLPSKLSNKGEINYRVTFGKGLIVVGESSTHWSVQNGEYEIRNRAEPRGLAALGGGRARWQISTGTVTAKGLRPVRFTDQREGSAIEFAELDWKNEQIVFSDSTRNEKLPAETQDAVSIFFHLAAHATKSIKPYYVATASKVARWNFDWVGEEAIEFPPPLGTLTGVHLQAKYDGLVTDVWLFGRYNNLPLKIRFQDRNGYSFDVTAYHVEEAAEPPALFSQQQKP